MKLVGLVFLGLVSGFAITYAAAYLIAWLLSLLIKTNGTAVSGGGGEATGLLIGFLVVFPIAFFIGGIVTGYFSYHEIDNKWSLPLIAPALYSNVLFLCVVVAQIGIDAFVHNDTTGLGFLASLWVPVALCFYWYLASLAGVALGYYLRERIVKWWYGD
jgi:hypothetical protein